KRWFWNQNVPPGINYSRRAGKGAKPWQIKSRTPTSRIRTGQTRISRTRTSRIRINRTRTSGRNRSGGQRKPSPPSCTPRGDPLLAPLRVGPSTSAPSVRGEPEKLRCRERLGGLLKYYEWEAAWVFGRVNFPSLQPR